MARQLACTPPLKPSPAPKADQEACQSWWPGRFSAQLQREHSQAASVWLALWLLHVCSAGSPAVHPGPTMLLLQLQSTAPQNTH
jgi:hypothetical protein